MNKRIGMMLLLAALSVGTQAKVRLHSGTIFGAGGSGFVRMNIACPKALLLKAISQIDSAIKNYL